MTEWQKKQIELKYPINMKHIRVTVKSPRKAKKLAKQWKLYENKRGRILIIGLSEWDDAIKKGPSWLKYLGK